MAVQVKVEEGTFAVTFYSRAGDTIAGGEEYNLEYSTDGGTTWNYIAGPLNSTSCTQHGTFDLPVYTLVKAVRDVGGQDIYYNLNDGSNTCPPNNNDVCGGSGIVPTGTWDVAMTIWVDGNGDFQEC